jgi:single-stranded DNA-binding protein
MSVAEGYGTYMGNLTRDWERREVTSQGEQKTIYTTSLAYQPKKDDPATFVDLTIWPDNNGSDREGQAVAANSGKGTRVMVRGKYAMNSYVSKNGEPKTGWKCSVWQVATVIRAPWEGDGGNAVKAAFPGAEEAPVLPKSHEPF